MTIQSTRVGLRIAATYLALACSANLVAAGEPIRPADVPAPGFSLRADAPDGGLCDAIQDGHMWLKLNYRFEYVEQDGLTKDAYASTLRSVLGYETGAWNDLTATLELEDVSPIGDDAYDSTINGKTDRPVVADPDSAELNQFFLKYSGWADAAVKLGRQRIKLDNDRFIGNIGWRQNEQTFDALSVDAKQVGPVDVFYGYLHNVNRVFGDESPVGDHAMDSHVLNVSHVFEDLGKLVFYYYLLDYRSADSLSCSTFGARFDGRRGLSEGADLLYTLEWANQTDAGDNPADRDANYMHGILGVDVEGYVFKVGMEVLEGSGDPGSAFQTPLATAHAFNGWADKFLTTPDTGLEDLFFSAGTSFGKTKVTAVYHQFSPDTGGGDYGSEIDAILTRPLGDDVDLGLKFADYAEDGFATDTTKAWFWLGYSF